MLLTGLAAGALGAWALALTGAQDVPDAAAGSSPASASSATTVRQKAGLGPPGPHPGGRKDGASADRLPRSDEGERVTPDGLTVADGVVPDGTTVFDDDVPSVARLDPALLDALRTAATDSGMTFDVTSGWRSAALQDRLFADAVARYGSEEEAARWAATSETSQHVSGDAVDLGPAAAQAWLAAHGAAYGLCQTYANEPWHYELRPEATSDGCPEMYADAGEDPRMQP
ncbi:M15 family metallopeptidase [Myceligenerans crystallogenes]|uniref:D-alanyl-D-alanine carboxypeptidase-like core domain-containing protein n=1 Tax=Myceligenerans crystallogenes TaxID=316335 RepID=A0ABN2NMC2_9MICO